MDTSPAVVERSWYALQSKPHHERHLSDYLSSEDIHVFAPVLHVKPVNPRAARVRPYFPGYLFIQLNLGTVDVDRLRWAPGSIGLVQFDGQPAIVPENVIVQLQHFLSQLASQPSLSAEAEKPLQPGDSVMIVGGAFAGYVGLFNRYLTGSERVHILLELLGRSVRAEINVKDIAPAH